MSGYIGTQPVPQATQTRDSFTATSGQTSFATGGYTPNFLDVYLNGVKLASGASADYTATNGSDVVLTSGAATGDILEVVAFTTFNSASSSIDDNGNATAITIDSNENVLIGRTSTADTAVGATLRPDGFVQSTRDGNIAADFNRNTSDGDIVRFSKGSSPVGSIQSRAGAMLSIAFNPSGSDGAGFTGGSNAVLPTNATALSDNAIDLGVGSYRYKDAYLSGGVYLGGTGSANKLDSYEEGTFTPTVTGSTTAGTVGGLNAFGKYTKIGRQVSIQMKVDYTSHTGSGDLHFGNFPFASGTNNPNEATGTIMANGCDTNSARPHLTLHMGGGSTYCNVFQTGDNINWSVVGVTNQAPAFRLSITYFTS